MANAKLKITMVKSRIGRRPTHRATLTGLGLRKINQSVIREDTPSIRGMVNKVYYMVTVEELKS